MSDNEFVLDLDQVATIKKDTTVNIAQPGGTERELRISIEFELIAVDQYEDLKSSSTVREVVERLLKRVDGVPPAKRGDEQFTPLQTAALIPDICHAIFGEIDTRHSRESRERHLAAYERGNSRQRRKR